MLCFSIWSKYTDTANWARQAAELAIQKIYLQEYILTKYIFSDDLFLLSIPTQFACQLPGHAAFQLTYKWSPSCQKHRIGKLLYSYHHENIYRYTKILREKFSVSTHFTTLRVHLCKTKLNLAFFLNQSWCDRIKGCQPKKPIYINLVHFFMSMIYEEV